MVEMLSDLLLGSGALGACIYCAVLSRKLTRFTDLEKGMGGAIAVLSVQVDDMTKALANAQVTAKGSSADLQSVIARADECSRYLEMLLASMHDLPSGTDGATSGQAEVDRDTSVTWRSQAHLKPQTQRSPQSDHSAPQWRRTAQNGSVRHG